MKNLRSVVLLLAVGLLTVSCTTFKAKDLSYNIRNPRTTDLGDFRAEVWVHELLGTSGGANILNITADATEEAVRETIRREIRELDGDAAIDVSIEYQASFINLILNGLTGAIYAPGTLIITGTVVRYD